MRPFEMSLLAANLVALLVLAIPPRGRVRWLRYAALVPLPVLAVHLLAEGPRWQMTPAYALGAAFAVGGSLLRRVGRWSGRTATASWSAGRVWVAPSRAVWTGADAWSKVLNSAAAVAVGGGPADVLARLKALLGLFEVLETGQPFLQGQFIGESGGVGVPNGTVGYWSVVPERRGG
ncbi:MAG TPA: hypothetical protein VM347_31930 [Nonomuraea sp.]|nr:hypothetical protein [Nonomuraea sp.]